EERIAERGEGRRRSERGGTRMRERRRAGFTLLELLVVIALITILAALLFPVLAAARGKARQAVCLQNLQQLASGMLLYSDDYDGSFPPVLGRQQDDEPLFPSS